MQLPEKSLIPIVLLIPQMRGERSPTQTEAKVVKASFIIIIIHVYGLSLLKAGLKSSTLDMSKKRVSIAQ